MKTNKLLLIGLLLPALGLAADPTIQLKVALKATTYSASGGKIVKNTILNSTLVSQCTAVAGAQLVAVFDTVTKTVVELDVVNPCGSNLCQVATFSAAGTCADTGIVNGKEELVCPLSFTSNTNTFFFGADVSADTKLTLDAQSQPTGGSSKMVGVVDYDGNFGVITLTVRSEFKPAGGCP